MKWIWKNPAKTLIFFTGVFLCMVIVLAGKYREEVVLKQDVVQYYSYLPATFIEGDLSMQYAHGNGFYADKIWGTVMDDGAIVQKYTMGLAVMYLPGFALGHLHASVSDHPANGYSQPYETWLQISSVFFLLIGMWFLRKVLRRYFSEWTIAITLFILIFGTNLFYYSVAQGPMPHVYIFCLLSIFLHLTLRFHEFPNWKNSILLALVGGLIVLIRPNHILVWLIPLLYDLERGKWGFWKKQMAKVATWPLIVFLVMLPQMLYWKTFAGDWIFYSYGDEGFFFNDPAVWSMWFSFRKGWLIYSPIMVLGLVGLATFGNLTHKWRFSAWAFFIATTYVLSSWWCWWYGGSYGQRTLIDLFPVLAIGIAGLRHIIFPITWLNRAFVAFILLCAMLNAFQTFQFASGILHYDSMTSTAYKAAFGKVAKPDGFDALLETPDYEAAKQGDR